MAYIILSTKDLQINPLRSLSEWWTSTFDLSRITPLGPPILATLVSPLTASNLEGESSWVQSVMGVLRWRERNSNRNNTSANSTGSPTPHTSLDMQVKLPPAISFVKSWSSTEFWCLMDVENFHLFQMYNYASQKHLYRFSIKGSFWSMSISMSNEYHHDRWNHFYVYYV